MLRLLTLSRAILAIVAKCTPFWMLMRTKLAMTVGARARRAVRVGNDTLHDLLLKKKARISLLAFGSLSIRQQTPRAAGPSNPARCTHQTCGTSGIDGLLLRKTQHCPTQLLVASYWAPDNAGQ